MYYQIGIDAGGTHTTAIAYDLTGRQELLRVETGQGNINADFDGGMANIKEAVRQIQAKLGSNCERILAGIAGISVTGQYKEVSETLASAFNTKAKAITDSLLALYKGLEGEDGIIVIAGTGSVVNGLQNGKILTVGGYGHLLGDEGSGYAISIAGLKSALHSWDKREKNDLIDLFTKHFEVSEMNDCNQKVYRLERPEIAGLARLIAELADNGSEDAQNVIFSQADLLADDIIMGLDRFADPKPMAIALTGSVLTNNKMLRTRVEDKVHAKYPNAKFVISSGSNASGILFDKNDDYYTA